MPGLYMGGACQEKKEVQNPYKENLLLWSRSGKGVGGANTKGA